MLGRINLGHVSQTSAVPRARKLVDQGVYQMGEVYARS